MRVKLQPWHNLGQVSCSEHYSNEIKFSDKVLAKKLELENGRMFFKVHSISRNEWKNV